MFLGNIVSEVNLKPNKLFNIVNNINNIDREIPTLIIGWDFSKRIYSDRKLSILDKNIDNNVNWTFTKKERRVDYDNDIKNFTNICLKNVENKVKYKYINILTNKCTTIKNLIKKVSSNELCYIYIYNNSFIYIYVDNEIIGVDFNSTDYLNIDRKKIYRILYQNNKLIFNNDFLSIDIKENIFNKQRLVPYLYAIQNGE